MTLPSTNVLWTLAGILGLLVMASTITWLLKRTNPTQDFGELSARVRSWWVMIALFSFAMAINSNISIIFLAVVSYLSLKEFLSLIPVRQADRGVLFIAYLAIPVQFYWVAQHAYGFFIVFIPVYMFLLLPFMMVLAGETRGFLRAAGTLHWGLMISVFALSHAAYLLALPEENNPVAGGAGLLLFLVGLTQLNDVSQFVWGKLLGRHKITPAVSPNKTWAGFLGGVATTTLVAWLIAPYLTPLGELHAVLAGLLISSAGFAGDLNISALKRDLNVKDSSQLIPGHGGIFDRVDSLTFAAPLFFHFIRYFYY